MARNTMIMLCYDARVQYPWESAPGMHQATWSEIGARFGKSEWRRKLSEGLRAAAEEPKQAECQKIYVDGSFVTAQEASGDQDGCWEERAVDLEALDPVLLDVKADNAAQRAKYLGEMFPASTLLEFFQTDRETGAPKGIVALDLREFP